jgi:pantoate--beta-alanine ligase
MILLKRVDHLREYLNSLRQQHKTIGFVPTMGALHTGHAALVQQSIREVDCTVCSIFVNPAQFNDPGDLAHYPRMPERDVQLLVKTGCDILFLPDPEEIYPPGQDLGKVYELGFLDQTMEGAHRPGHFQGVARVMERLLDIVEPHRLYMGEKDFQQCAVVQCLLQQLNSPAVLVRCPTVREADGLALSSRNLLLSEQERRIAPGLYQALCQARSNYPSDAPQEIEQEALRQLTAAGFHPEYFQIVDGDTLRPVSDRRQPRLAVACTAARLGRVRLIDNLLLSK